MSETIAALSSGLVPSGVAVIRVSGPRARFALEVLVGDLPPPRYAALKHLRDPKDGSVLDQALVLFFPSPDSFTGEDVVEFHCHGGRAVVDSVLAVLWSLDGVGPAEPGAFTRQAFANGKLDLTQVEAVGDLIHASTRLQSRQALDQLGGAASRRLMDWRDRIVDVRALLEADLDFSDEDDVPGSILDSVPERIERLITEMRDDLEDRSAERIRDGFRIVLVGAPNAGKSTLLNALLDRQAALVSPIAGTTRDRIEAAIDLDGLPVLLSDTAGIRASMDTTDSIEAMGIDRSLEAIGEADCVVWLSDAEHGEPDLNALIDEHWIRVRSKMDLMLGVPVTVPAGTLFVSGHTGEGLSDLRRMMAGVLRRRHSSAQGSSVNTVVALNSRRRQALDGSVNYLQESLNLMLGEQDRLAEVAEMLRLSQRALGKISGDVDTEAVLDVLFNRFCIGK